MIWIHSAEIVAELGPVKNMPDFRGNIQDGNFMQKALLIGNLMNFCKTKESFHSFNYRFFAAVRGIAGPCCTFENAGTTALPPAIQSISNHVSLKLQGTGF